MLWLRGLVKEAKCCRLCWDSRSAAEADLFLQELDDQCTSRPDGSMVWYGIVAYSISIV